MAEETNNTSDERPDFSSILSQQTNLVETSKEKVTSKNRPRSSLYGDIKSGIEQGYLPEMITVAGAGGGRGHRWLRQGSRGTVQGGAAALAQCRTLRVQPALNANRHVPS